MIDFNVLALLNLEDEFSLNYLHSHQLDRLKHLQDKKVKRSGKILRSSTYVMRSLFSSTLQVAEERTDLLIFSGSLNQFSSLGPLVKVLAKNNPTCFKHYIKEGLFEKRITKDRFPHEKSLGYSFTDVLNGFLVSLLRQFYILKHRLIFHPKLYSSYYDKLLWVHIYLRRFTRLVEQATPELVIMSNDHNFTNRCLRLAAYQKDIATVYLQHASVSELFPALAFDHSFLDGEVSLETYLECEKNKTTSSLPQVRNIYLSGQKKDVLVEKKTPRYVGIAVNTLDELPILLELVSFFTDKGIDVNVRTHPSQPNDFVEALNEYASTNSRVVISSPPLESLKDFFSCCHYMISGNSSIHLEAALAGLMTYYYEFSTSIEHRDYYGYVEKGLSFKWLPEFRVMDSKCLMNLSKVSEERVSAVKKYSATYGTQWQGREGALVFETITRILGQQNMSDLYNEDLGEIGRGFKIYRLKIF